ncbi:iron complex transport system substrate-binding protein [Porphyromonadaceae bacterium KH3R12]|nr:iron complex transport system substrate-binding protein [Porphyromonadaceae bacterium KH3R12]
MKTKIFLFALGTIIALSGCTGNQQQKERTGETITVTHTLGTVEVPVNPERVIALDFSALENLDYLGIKPVAIPKSGIPSHLSKYKDDPSIADVGTVVEVNLEKINELQPDLIIIGGRLADFYKDLSAIAPVIYPTVMGTTDFLGVFKSNLDDLGRIFNKQDELDRAFAEIETKVEEMKAKVEASDERALILLHNRGRFSAYGSGSRFGIIHDVLGFQEAEKGLGTQIHGTPVSSEFVQKANPDIIFIVDRSMIVGNAVMDKEEVENKLVKQTNAAQNGRIFYLNPEVWYLAGGGITSVNMMIDEVSKAL